MITCHHWLTRELLASATFEAEPDVARYRYDLTFTWDLSLPSLAFVMLNPSTATHEKLDPTVTRCLGFARSWGYGRLSVRNCFAWRATDPKALREPVDPTGPMNDAWLRDLVTGTDLVIAAWGTHAVLYRRDLAVRRILSEHPHVRVLGLTKQGHPKHPLYVAGATIPQKWIT